MGYHCWIYLIPKTITLAEQVIQMPLRGSQPFRIQNVFVFSIIPVSEVADFFDVLVFALMRHSVPKRCPTSFGFDPNFVFDFISLTDVIDTIFQ